MTVLGVVGTIFSFLLLIATAYFKWSDKKAQAEAEAEKARQETFDKNRVLEKERETELSTLNQKIKAE